MDTTKEYILMCEKAKEIQKQADFIKHNWVALPSKEIFGMDKGFQFISYGKIPKEYYIYLWLANQPQYSKLTKSDWETFIWLPTQDQLQEMVRNIETETWTFKDNKTLIAQFSHWCWQQQPILKIQNTKAYKSMEQFWLAFVMKEKYGKVWNRKEWVNNA